MGLKNKYCHFVVHCIVDIGWDRPIGTSDPGIGDKLPQIKYISTCIRSPPNVGVEAYCDAGVSCWY